MLQPSAAIFRDSEYTSDEDSHDKDDAKEECGNGIHNSSGQHGKPKKFSLPTGGDKNSNEDMCSESQNVATKGGKQHLKHKGFSVSAGTINLHFMYSTLDYLHLYPIGHRV